jgi:hypothetical protein
MFCDDALAFICSDGRGQSAVPSVILWYLYKQVLFSSHYFALMACLNGYLPVVVHFAYFKAYPDAGDEKQMTQTLHSWVAS